MIKYSSSGETWVENVPYCPPTPPTLLEEEETKQEASDRQQQLQQLLPNEEPPPTTFRHRADATARHNKQLLQLSAVSEDTPSRSFSVSFAQPVPIRRRGNMRRKSMSMIKKGHTGEVGSEAFKQALEKDAPHEVHPGWKSVRRVAGAIG